MTAKRHVSRVGSDGGASDDEGGLERRLGEVGEGRSRLGQACLRVGAGDVEGGDAEQLAAVLDAQGVLGGRALGRCGDRGGEQVDALLDLEVDGVDDRGPVLGSGHEVVAQRRRGTEEGEEPVSGAAGLAQARGPAPPAGRRAVAWPRTP